MLVASVRQAMENTSEIGEGVVFEEPSPDQAFALLADETRLGILKALWELSDPLDPVPIPFSTLRSRVGTKDPGQFNYHLSKLAEQYIRRTDDGYVFREAGERIVRVIISGVTTDSRYFDPVEIGVACLFCGEETAFSYRNGWGLHQCTSCHARCVEEYPPGQLSKEELPTSGLVNRSPAEVYVAHRIWEKHREASVMERICPECSGDMPVAKLRICQDHDPDPLASEVCDSCGSIFWGVAYHVCEVCKNLDRLPTFFYPSIHPAVIAFYYDHGIDFDIGTAESRSRIIEYEETLVSEDPLRIRTTIREGDDAIHLEFDESMQVVEVYP